MGHDTTEGPKRMRGNEAARYLREVHGLPIQEKTLRNKRWAGVGPRCTYFGSTPLYEREELDRWVEEEALSERPANAHAGECAAA